jgi:hypothetical protein
MNLEILFSKDYVYCIPLKYISIEKLSFFLPQLLFYDPPKLLHYHYNTNNNERLLMVSMDGYIKLLPHLNDNIFIKKYHIVQIMNTQDIINDTGIVANISYLFSQSNISILYLTTLENNFILFEEEYYDESINILSQLTDNIIYDTC